MIANVILYTNGQFLVVDENDNQLGSIQKILNSGNWDEIKPVLERMKTEGTEIEICKWEKWMLKITLDELLAIRRWKL